MLALIAGLTTLWAVGAAGWLAERLGYHRIAAGLLIAVFACFTATAIRHHQVHYVQPSGSYFVGYAAQNRYHKPGCPQAEIHFAGHDEARVMNREPCPFCLSGQNGTSEGHIDSPTQTALAQRGH